MEQSLDAELMCDAVEYDLMDALVPALSVRHIPRILREPDTVVKCYELGINALFNTTQAAVYVPLLYSLTEKLLM